MNPSILENNLALLAKRDPDLTASLRSIQPTGKYIASPSRSGPATLSIAFPDGKRKTIHSAYDPVQEAVRFIDSCQLNDSTNFIITGMGLGYHATETIKRAPRHARVVIIEKDPELFYLALSCNDLSSALTHTGATFHIGINPDALQNALSADTIPFALNGYNIVSFKPLVEAEIAYYHTITKSLENLFQSARIDFNTQAAFSKSFYNNIIDNLPFIIDSPGVNSLSNHFKELPAIIVSAGPSLDKNIALLKNVQNHVVLISVSTALTPLLRNSIEPDFVVAIDPDETMVKAFDLESTPQRTRLLFDPCVFPVIPETYKANRVVFDSGVYLSQWLAKYNEEKGSLGKVQSVAHTALKFAQSLGCKPIILTGQDLSFNRHRMHCSGSFFYESRQDALKMHATMDLMDQENHQIYSRALVKTADIFGNPITTTEAMKSYNNLFADENIDPQHIINATEGGLPIPKVQNLSLKEALHTYCHKTIQAPKINLSTKRKPSVLTAALQTQADKFAKLQKKLLDIKTRLSANPGKTGQEQFISDMELFYRSMIADTDTVLLLQGYAYSSFLQWNQKQAEIAKKQQKCIEEEVLQIKFNRDRQFVDELIEALRQLESGFEKMHKKASSLNSR